MLQDYAAIFALSAVSAALNIVNFLTYPKFLDGEREKPGRLREVLSILWKATLNCFAATVLSVESQATSIGIAIVSPLLGLAVDATPETYRFAPIALFGVAIVATAIVFQPAVRTAATQPVPEGRV